VFLIATDTIRHRPEPDPIVRTPEVVMSGDGDAERPATMSSTS
jgi:hypothetical protein